MFDWFSLVKKTDRQSGKADRDGALSCGPGRQQREYVFLTHTKKKVVFGDDRRNFSQNLSLKKEKKKEEIQDDQDTCNRLETIWLYKW